MFNFAKQLPLWARVVAWVGFPAVMALLLSWFVISVVAEDLDNLQEVPAVVEQTRDMLEQLIHYQRLICSNTAVTESQRIACLTVRP